MSWRRQLRAACLPAAAVLSIEAGCGPDPAPRGALSLERLDAARTLATLGSETRRCVGPDATVLFYGDLDSPAALPEFLSLRPSLVRADRIVLVRRIWEREGSERGALTSVSAATLPVDRNTPEARIRLHDLPPADLPSAASVQLVGFPLSASPIAFDATTRLPPGARLRFGFGIREETWDDTAGAVRFEVALQPESGERRVIFAAVVDPANLADRRWHDTELALSEWAGRSVRLEFVASHTANAGGRSLPVWSDPVIVGEPRDREMRNVVIISLDTLRARNLGAYGYARDTSPFFDALALRGTLFEEAITTSVTTAPSHMSLITGLYPVRHGVRRGLDHRRSGSATLAEQFRAAGYRTVAFTENGYIVRQRGFGDGFDEYTENRGEHTKALGEARLSFGQARQWLRSNRDLPFFLFLHTYEVHSPYKPAEPYARLFDGDGAAGPEARVVREARDRYDREIRVVDDQLRGFFDELDATGLASSTLVAILADHGEEFGEHGGFQHGGAVFEEALRIPLLLWEPGRIPAGSRRGEIVSLIDVAPTLLEWRGLPVPAGLDGVSLAPLLRGGEAPAPRRLVAEAQSTTRWLDPLVRVPWNPPLFAVRDGHRKYIVHRPDAGDPEPTQLFDLDADPEERSPLPVGDAAAHAVEAWIADFAGGRTPARLRATPSDGVESPELLERLRALGYAE